MRLILRDGLPFASVAVSYREQEVEVADVVVDTGSASTILAADAVETWASCRLQMTVCTASAVLVDLRSCSPG